jgi:DNA-binding XRE family transcriptional regulator
VADLRKNLKDKRKEFGYTQKSFSKKIKVSIYTYRKVEQGVCFPNKKLRIKIMKNLHVSSLNIFDEEANEE